MWLIEPESPSACFWLGYVERICDGYLLHCCMIGISPGMWYDYDDEQAKYATDLSKYIKWIQPCTISK
jgi:hypothetical protein